MLGNFPLVHGDAVNFFGRYTVAFGMGMATLGSLESVMVRQKSLSFSERACLDRRQRMSRSRNMRRHHFDSNALARKESEESCKIYVPISCASRRAMLRSNGEEEEKRKAILLWWHELSSSQARQIRLRRKKVQFQPARSRLHRNQNFSKI